LTCKDPEVKPAQTKTLYDQLDIHSTTQLGLCQFISGLQQWLRNNSLQGETRRFAAIHGPREKEIFHLAISCFFLQSVSGSLQVNEQEVEAVLQNQKVLEIEYYDRNFSLSTQQRVSFTLITTAASHCGAGTLRRAGQRVLLLP